MIEFEEIEKELSNIPDELKKLYSALKIDELKTDVKTLEQKTADDSFWLDPSASKKTLQKISAAKTKIEKYERLISRFDDLKTLLTLANEEEDTGLLEEITAEKDGFLKDLEDLTLSTLLSGEYDNKNAILSFHAGAGGTEAQDWNEMLVRMYTRFSERHGFKVKMIDFLNGEEAGLKSAVLLIEGANAYGYLKGENGVHRLVRISPFDASGRRHTSFASLEVMPEIDDEDNSIEIRDEDLKVDTYRSGGAGGQHVNKTESAVRITHIPTGVIVACQNERSQHQNREVALKMLKSKLIEIKEREHLEKIEDIKGVHKEIAWGSQIRSYVFMPYTLVKDHRTGAENGNINAVMDGDIDVFINAYLTAVSRGEIK